VRDLTALVMLAACAFLAAALATFDPADPPLSRVFPPNARAVNACGLIGSAVAGALYESLGLGSWFAVALLVGLDIAVLRRRPLPDMPLRTIGAAVALAGSCTLLTLFLSDWIDRPLWGPGGRLGAMGRLLVDSYLARTGGAIVVIAATLGGLFLACDTLLLAVVTAFGTALATAAGGIGAMAGRLTARRAAKPDLLDADDIAARFPGLRGRFGTAASDDADEDDAMDDGEPTIRVKRREVTAADDAVAGVEIDDSEPLPADDIAEETPAAAAAQPLVPIRSLSSRRKPQATLELSPDPAADYELPSLDLLLATEYLELDQQEQEVRDRAKVLEKTFGEFGFKVKVVEIEEDAVVVDVETSLHL
jgi:S-DNA-T family DNA segregation ATPase FtsK/SpoIIIE